jgi:hypothetical protein
VEFAHVFSYVVIILTVILFIENNLSAKNKSLLNNFQSTQGLIASPSCYYLYTDVTGFTMGPWKGPVNMKQGRQYPKLVSLQRKVITEYLTFYNIT